MDMQLQQLRYVVCVAEEGRFTRAAARLHVAQPSISSAVAALEQELGTQLFHRDRAEVTLGGNLKRALELRTGEEWEVIDASVPATATVVISGGAIA